MSHSEIHSQASNALDFVKTGVDARTGQFNLALALPLPPANQLDGPALGIVLSFNSMASTVNRGYGLGWALGLSEIDLDQAGPRLSLGSGDRYAIDLARSGMSAEEPLRLLDMKLETVRVTWQADGSLRVDKKSGEREVLHKPDESGSRYLLAQLISPEGRSLYFDWSPFGDGEYILEQVRDDQRTLLTLANTESQLSITLNPQTPQAVRFLALLSNELLTQVELPGVDRPLVIEYEAVPAGALQLQLPVRIDSPLGALDRVRWASGEDGHRLPAGAPFDYLPKVSTWSHASGPGLPELIHTYAWTGDHNYLGFGSDQAFDWQAGRDNLHQVESDYQYQLVETLSDNQGTALGRIERTWDRFHLQVSESHRLGDCETRKTTRHGIDPTLSWEQQPPWCQLPHEVSTTYIDHAREGASRTQTTTYRYDDFGNILYVRYPSGIEEQHTYYPSTGDEGCPPDPLGMVRLLRQTTTRPAEPSGGAPTLSTRYTYQSLPSLIDAAPPCLVLASESLYDEQHDRLLEHTQHLYALEPGPGYGQVQRSLVTLGDKTTTTQVAFELNDEERIRHVTTQGFENDDENRSTLSCAQSLLTGQTRWERSESGVLTRYDYDAIGRITCTQVAVDSPYQRESQVSYHLGDPVALDARGDSERPAMMIEQREATGRRQRQWLDGDGRTLCIEREDLDNAPGRFREIQRNQHDALGRLVSQDTLDWLGEAASSPQVLTTTCAFDDWGQQASSLGPDGVRSHVQQDPVTQRSERWQSAGDLLGPRLVTLHNAAGSVVEQQHLDTAGACVRTLKRVRDGLDRVIEEHLMAPDLPSLISRLRYDHYSRVIEKQLADGTVLSWTYAAHSDGQHPESLQVVSTEQEAGE